MFSALTCSCLRDTKLYVPGVYRHMLKWHYASSIVKVLHLCFVISYQLQGKRSIWLVPGSRCCWPSCRRRQGKTRSTGRAADKWEDCPRSCRWSWPGSSRTGQWSSTLVKEFELKMSKWTTFYLLNLLSTLLRGQRNCKICCKTSLKLPIWL